MVTWSHGAASASAGEGWRLEKVGVGGVEDEVGADNYQGEVRLCSG